jgi:type II secretory pathway component PulK
LWLIVAISAIVLDLGLWTKVRSGAAFSLLQAEYSREAGSAGIARAKAMIQRDLIAAQPLIANNPSLRFDVWRGLPPLDSPVDDALRYQVQFRDAASSLNINTSNEMELQRFFAALGYSADRAAQLAARVLDWRDADDNARPGGAEAADYVAAGRAITPANNAFGGNGDFAELLGVEASDAARVTPLITTVGSGIINLNTASAPVLASVAGVSVEAANAIVELRDRAGPLASVFAVLNEISVASRDSLLTAATSLSLRLTAEVNELEARSNGYVRSGEPDVAVTVLFVRRGTDVNIMFRRLSR